MDKITPRLLLVSGYVVDADVMVLGASASDLVLQLPGATGSYRTLYIGNGVLGGNLYISYSGVIGTSLKNYRLGAFDFVELVDTAVGVWSVIRRTSDRETQIRTVKKTIGGIGISADFNFVTASNTTEQVIDLGAIIPPLARVLDVFCYTNAVFTGATTLVAEVGNSSSGAQFIASATIYAADAFNAMAHSLGFNNAPNVAATHVYVAATPGANWSNVTAGLVSVYTTFIDAVNF